MRAEGRKAGQSRAAGTVPTQPLHLEVANNPMHIQQACLANLSAALPASLQAEQSMAHHIGQGDAGVGKGDAAQAGADHRVAQAHDEVVCAVGAELR